MTVRISYLEIYNETMFDLLSTFPESTTASSGLNLFGSIEKCERNMLVIVITPLYNNDNDNSINEKC